MKLGLKAKIDVIMKCYEANNKTQEKEIRTILEPYKLTGHRYTVDGLRQEISEKLKPIMDDWKNYDIVLNQNLNAAITEAKEKLLKALRMIDAKKKPADYATSISNAIQFVKVALEDAHIVTADEMDEELYSILKDFMDDYNTMKQFKKMVEKKYSDFINANGECVLPKTFGKIVNRVNFMNTLEKIEAAADEKNLFAVDREETSNEIVRIQGISYSVPTHPYSVMNDIETIKNCAVILDSLAEEIDVEGLSNSTDEGTKAETEGQFTEGQNFDANGHPYTATNTVEGGAE